MKKSILALLLGIISLSCSQEYLQTDLNLVSSSIKAAGRTKPGGGGTTAPLVYRTGDEANITTPTSFGIALIGGAESDTPAELEAFKFLVSKSGGGDFVVLRASGADGYNPYIYSTIGGVNSVETLVISSRSMAEDPLTLTLVNNAEAIFIAGGDQGNYINYWKDTKLEAAINNAVNIRNVPIGGTSAGLAVLGSHYYGATAGSATSAKALANPYYLDMQGLGGGDFLSVNYMQNVITDSHYGERTRQGRHFTFMARLVKDFELGSTVVKGIGVDEATAVLVESNGTSKVFGAGKAYFLKGNAGAPEVCVSKKPLTWSYGNTAVAAYVIQGTSAGINTFNLVSWSGSGGVSQLWSANAGNFQMN